MDMATGFLDHLNETPHAHQNQNCHCVLSHHSVHHQVKCYFLGSLLNSITKEEIGSVQQAIEMVTVECGWMSSQVSPTSNLMEEKSREKIG
jgi:hypothetical protein